MKNETRVNMFNAIKDILQMQIPVKHKSRMLSTIHSMEPNHWRVTGISEEALRVFHENDYKYRTKIGINRSHIISRKDAHLNLLQQFQAGCIQTVEQWWAQFWGSDATCLTTASENMKKSDRSRIIYFDNPGFSLFRSKGFAWKHGKEEEDFLRALYRNHASKVS